MCSLVGWCAERKPHSSELLVLFFAERDRDRLRERQRQERQQMLPNDEKDINVGAQDLFHAPVKVIFCKFSQFPAHHEERTL